MTNAETGITANADAIEALAGRMTNAETGITANADAISAMDAAYKAADKALDDRLKVVEPQAASAVQSVVVSNLDGVEAKKEGTAITIDCAQMVIDCGTWE